MYFFYLKAPLDFPGGPVVKNPLVNAEDTGFSSWSEPYARGQLSLWASATEALLCTEKPLPWEARTLQLERSPHSLQLEKPGRSNKDPAQPKINVNK